MSTRLSATASIALAIALTGCSLIDTIRFSAAEYAGRAVLLECGLSDVQRLANITAVNGWLSGRGHVPRAMPLDCDGDGTSDL